VDGRRVVEAPPPPEFTGLPSLTVPMAAAIQGFPPDWRFIGKRTHAYRQVGNAFPPPVAREVGKKIAAALRASRAGVDPRRTAELAA
jgi:DNA (cytosine-5)-methyltransferase 1